MGQEYPEELQVSYPPLPWDRTIVISKVSRDLHLSAPARGTRDTHGPDANRFGGTLRPWAAGVMVKVMHAYASTR